MSHFIFWRALEFVFNFPVNNFFSFLLKFLEVSNWAEVKFHNFKSLFKVHFLHFLLYRMTVDEWLIFLTQFEPTQTDAVLFYTETQSK